jgi:DNA-binding MarR family transcriptional regulator
MPLEKHKIEVKPPVIGDQAVAFKLIRVVNLVARPFQEMVAKQHQLTLNEWRVMLVVHSHPECTASDVVDYSGLDKMSVSRALARLTKASRVQRFADKQDARRQIVVLTSAGNRLFTKIGQLAAIREQTLFSTLSATEVKKLGQLVDKLTDALLNKAE